MSNIVFPSSPTLNQAFTYGIKTWKWNGYAWDLQLFSSSPNPVLGNDVFTGNGSTTSFQLSVAPYNKNSTLININGVTQQKTEYTITGSTLVFNTAPLSGDVIEVLEFATSSNGVFISSSSYNAVAGSLYISNTTVSTSNTTGALTVAGGVGVGSLTIGNSGSTITNTDIYDFDDISYRIDGFTNTFKLSYNGTQVNTASPYLISVTVNGMKQTPFNSKYDTVWLASILTASKGYTIDVSGNPTTNNWIKFADTPLAGSQIEIGTVVGSIPSQSKIYPFKPLDVVMGF